MVYVSVVIIMSDSCCGNKKGCQSMTSSSEKEALDIDGELKIRPRSPTLLNLSWLRDRLNRVKMIKDKLSSSTYSVDPEKLLKALIDDK